MGVIDRIAKGETELINFLVDPTLRQDFTKAYYFFGFNTLTDAMKFWMRELVRLYEEERKNGRERGHIPRIYTGNIHPADE